MGVEEHILSSVLKYDMGEDTTDSSCNDDVCECSTYRADNTRVLSTAARGTATSEHTQAFLAVVREHLYLLPIKCLECILSDIEGVFFFYQQSVQITKHFTYLNKKNKP